jgi:ADP-ribosylglycohydrolase
MEEITEMILHMNLSSEEQFKYSYKQAGIDVDAIGLTYEKAKFAGRVGFATNGPPADFRTQQGWVLNALQNAFFQLLHASNLEEGVIATVMAGGDTDTNAAIAGALLGAVHGRDAVPARWRAAVLTCRASRDYAAPKRRREEYWPVDTLELAERLLVLSHESLSRRGPG